MKFLRREELNKRLCSSNLDRLKLEKTIHLRESKDDDIGLPSVDFNDAIFFGSRAERVLDVAFTNNT
jgi:hypothetical protein